MSHVVILGGGFAGLYAARGLAHADCAITLVDRHNYHLFQPLLYQVATAALNPSDIAAPIRAILRHQKNVEVILGDATSVDAAQKQVHLADGATLAYDYLVIATGATHSYFGHPEWERFAPGLKTIDDALEIRRRVLLAFEAAEREEDPATQQALLTFVVIGGGPTGVELAGALSEIARQTMLRDFRRIHPEGARVILTEGRERVLPPYPPSLSESARKQLVHLGVEVITGAIVTGVNDTEVCIGERSIATRTVLWGAGVQASPLAHSLGVPLDRAGRVLVEPELTIPGHRDVFVIGDLAAAKQRDGAFVPGVAPAAIQEGQHTARNLERALEGQPLRAFRYRDKGSLATIGRAAAVADFGRIRFGGFFAWLAWLVIHIFFLIGFRNRFLVITQWAWAYLTYQRGARLITGERIGDRTRDGRSTT
ncbi:MAG: NAD(P)/FAD-dependent oxidoreductase [Acidobacteria bacterium]|nr:NAD(P)/FAD-dependent oxidoreductase [Acidobacteriota bacterium]MBV9476120.1 NAD(P)/FAD-dependent oxidoreductase [Acidobacteriota bacterium]